MKYLIFCFVSVITKIRWTISRFVIIRKHSFSNYSKIPDIRQALIIVPHADDEWIGCSRILTNYKNTILLYMNMRGGNDDKERIERYAELKQISTQYDLELCSINENNKNELKYAIYNCKPSHIFIPFYFDWHDEHIKCMQILKKVLQSYPYDVKVAMYQVSLPILPTNLITNVEVMSKEEWKQKWDVFVNVYKSQLDIPYIRFGINERCIPLDSIYYAAEAYSVHNKEQWLHNLDGWILSDDEKKKAKDNLNNLVYIYKFLKKIRGKRKWIS